MKFSIAMCVWQNDDVRAFKNATESCLTQTLLPSQFVLVIDGPVPIELSEAIESVVAQFRLLEIETTTYMFEKNVGHGLARRKSIELCNFDLVAICDADDINLNNRFYEQAVFLQSNPNFSVVGSYMQECVSNNNTHETTYDFKGIRKVPLSHSEIVKYIRNRCPMNQMTVMFRKSDIQDVGGYQDFYHNEDYYLWCRLILANKKMANIPVVLVNALVTQDTYNRRGGVGYFKSEVKIQSFMVRNRMTNIFLFSYNIFVRFLIQIVIPSSWRKLIFQKLLRV